MSTRIPLLDQIEWSYRPTQPYICSAHEYHIVYRRAKSLVIASDLSVDDIVHLTPKFWKFHLDLVTTRDFSAMLIAQLHLNLCVGTIGAYRQHRPDLTALLQELMSFETCASFLLTEFGHGLDVKNLETTATLMPDGSFDLHSPNENSAKTMPAATPLAGIKRIGVVMARLIAQGEDRGLKLFITPLSGPSQMHPGVTAWMLPARPGTTPLDNAITSFNHVQLPPGALLGTVVRPENPQNDLHHQLWRLSVGVIALSLGHINCLKVGTYIAACYSKRRFVEQTAKNGLVPIISFSTQYRPILQGLVAAEMLQTLANWSINIFTNPDLSIALRRGLAIIFKATAIHYFRVMPELAERCGWRGYYCHNQITELYLSYSVNATGEGDMQVFALRLIYEILTGQCTLPEPEDPCTLLARHEAGIFSEFQECLGTGRSKPQFYDTFDTDLLPRCRYSVVAMGQRMAFEAAKRSQEVSPQMLDAFEKICIAEDASWYIEHLGYTRRQIFEAETAAYTSLLPLLDQLLDKTGAKPYVTSTLVSDGEWDDLISQCFRFTYQQSGIPQHPFSIAKQSKI